MIIKPTIHRHVDFFTSVHAEPQVGIITKVWHDRLVNLAVFDENGDPILGGKQNVLLCHDEDKIDDVMEFCKFPPYSLHQARTQPPVPNHPIVDNGPDSKTFKRTIEEPTEENTAPAK